MALVGGKIQIRTIYHLRKTLVNKGFTAQLQLFKLGKSKDIFKHFCLVFILYLLIFFSGSIYDKFLSI